MDRIDETLPLFDRNCCGEYASIPGNERCDIFMRPDFCSSLSMYSPEEPGMARKLGVLCKESMSWLLIYCVWDHTPKGKCRAEPEPIRGRLAAVAEN